MRPSRVRYSMVVLAIGLAVLSYVQRVAISVAAGPIARDLHIPKAQMGLIFGAFALSYALFEVPMGVLGDRLGRQARTDPDRAGMVAMHRPHRSGMERDFVVRDPFSIRSRRGRMLS